MKKVSSNFLDGFVRVPLKEDATEIRDFKYHFICSPEGLELVQKARLDQGRDETWWPDTLPFSTALAGVASMHDTLHINRLAGFPDDVAAEVIQMTDEELEARKESRMDSNDGVDPDDRFYTAKTPKKKKKGQELSRTFDRRVNVSAIQFGSAQASKDWEGVGGLELELGDTPEFPSSLKEDDAARKKALDAFLAKQDKEETEQLSDYTDFEDGWDNPEPVLKRIAKHPSYVPSATEVAHLSSEDKRAITMQVKHSHPEMSGFSLAKPGKKGNKSKAKGKGRSTR